MRRVGACAARRWLAALALAIAAAPAAAVIPSAAKIAEAVAAANRAAGRSEPLWFDVALRIGDAEPVATGEMAAHPTGLARLELKNQRGFVERHLLQGNAYRASRDGKLLPQPHPFLPPIFLLQASTGAALQAALASFGVSSGEAVLGRVGDHDCYVFGGRLPRAADGQEQLLPSLWVDLESFQVVRIDRGDGTRLSFGPFAAFEGIQMPRWIAIEAPDQPVVKLEINRVARANAPAAAFGTDWLTAPRSP